MRLRPGSAIGRTRSAMAGVSTISSNARHMRKYSRVVSPLSGRANRSAGNCAHRSS